MFAVRYAALVALAVWLGGLVVLSFIIAPSATRGSLLAFLKPFEILGIACGAIVLISLFTMKFVGPPPHGFHARVVIALVMLAISAYAAIGAIDDLPSVLTTISIVLGLIMLTWYVRDQG